MRLTFSGLCSTAVLAVLAAGPSAQVPAPARPAAPTPQEQPTFSVLIDLVTTDVIARDEKGNFVADLTKDNFELYEDGVKQDIASMTLSHGGRVTNVLAPPPPPPPEGIILPPARRTSDVSGRIFVFFIDDLHLQFQNTPRVRELFKKISKTLVHDGDMFGIVSSGTSSISVQMTYDKSRLDEAISKITGGELKPSEIISGPAGSGGPSEVRYRARVAMDTVNELLGNLEKVHDRRKALVYVSDGYDFTPFQASRLGFLSASSPFLQNDIQRFLREDSGDVSTCNTRSTTCADANNPSGALQRQNEEFSDVDLAIDLRELTRTANRANTTIYTIDPRGLVGMSDLDEPVEPKQWSEFIAKSQDTLRVIAEETGGLAVVNQNDFDKALKLIDAESSDYYVLGYYSKNPDPTKRRRLIDVRVTRPGISVWSRKEYVLRPSTAPVSSSRQ